MLKKQSVHILLILILGLLAYSNTFNVPFQFDDRGYIVDNPIIKDFKYFKNPFASAKLHDSFYSYSFKNRFISDFTFALNYKIHGLNVAGYHVVNLLIHLINALLVYWLVLMTLKSGVRSQESEFSSQNSEKAISSEQLAVSNKLTANRYPLTAGISLFPTSCSLLALFSALIFISHPVQTEAVTYIYQRFTSLATMFYLLSLVMYVKWRLKAEQQSSRTAEQQVNKTALAILRCRTSALLLYCAGLLSAVLAMKTKEIAFTLPIIIVLYEIFFFSKSQIQQSTVNSQQSTSRLTSYVSRFLYLLPFLLTLLIIPLSYTGINKSGADLLHVVDKAARTSAIPRIDYLFTQFRVIVTYLRLLFLPVNQNLDYDYPIYNSFLNSNVFLSFLFLLSVLGLGVYLFYYSKKLSSFNLHPSTLRFTAFGIFWFFITLSVESSVMPLEDVIFEHRLYLPSIGLIIAFVSAVFYFSLRLTPYASRLTLLTLAAILIVFSIAAYQRNAVWQNEIALWEDIAKKSPGKARVHSNLGSLYITNGMTDKAVSEFQQAVSINPDYIEARKNLITAYINKEALDDALDELITLSNLIPGNANIFTPIGGIYIKKGEPDKAIEYLNQALLLNPQHINALTDLGIAYASKGWNDKAVSTFDKAIGINPDFAFAYYNRGLIYAKKNNHQKAIADFSRACALGYKEGCISLKTTSDKKQD
ncbi:MAG: tetratricopeptide repeat protein [Nitrospirae bacterium]|nr:tetratricopeptide repeat protein [Nitrospirota bacterium]